MARELRILLVGVTLLLGGPPPALGQSADAGEQPTSTAQAAPATGQCAQPTDYARCAARCAPEKQTFLPCMAVSATNMAACRAREVAQCHAHCTQRYC